MKKPKNKEEYLEKIKALKLFDDDFMNIVFQDRACLELLLDVILNIKHPKISQFETQKRIDNEQGRSIILDLFMLVNDSRYVNFEVQRNKKGASDKRMRMHASLMDMILSYPGMDFEDMFNTCVIFIVEFDKYGLGWPIYYVNRAINKIFNLFEDEADIIVVNGTYRGDDPIGRLMHDFSCSDAKEMYNEVLSKRVKYLKEEEGVNDMCEIFDNFRIECEIRSETKTVINALKSLIKNLNLSLEEAMKVLEIKSEDKDKYRKLIN